MGATSIGEIGLDLVVNSNGFKRQMSGIESLAKKAAAALAGAFAVKKIVDFGKKCIELGSDLSEVQNVVDVTFPSMTKKVDEFAKSAATSFGLSEKMAKQYTGTFGAMAKAFGFSEKQAYDMGTALTGLAGDVASFYNISQDEAYTKLKSVFTGETETLKDLGVVMTQSALDAYALANGYGKTTQAMSEMEKVALRYQFVQSNLSTAQGDFARTSDSWANGCKILSLQVQSLMSTIGQGLINLFTPILKIANTVLGRIATLANAFKAFTELITGKKSGGGSSMDAPVSNLSGAADTATTGLGNASDAADKLGKSTSGVGKAAQKAAKEMRSLMGFDQINKISERQDDSSSSDISSPSSSGSGVGGNGGGIGSAVDFGSLAKGKTVIDEVDDKFSKMFGNITKLCEPAVKSLKQLWNEGLSRLKNFAWTALKDFYSGFLVPVGKWTIGTGIPRFVDALNNGLMKVNFPKINGSLKNLWDALTPFAIHVGEGLLWLWEKVLVPLGTWTASEVVPRFLDTLTIAVNGLNKIIEALQPLFQWFWDNVLQPLAQWTGEALLTAWDGFNSALEKFSNWLANNIPTVDEFAQKFEDMKQWLSDNQTELELLGIALTGFATAILANIVASNAMAIAHGAASIAIGVYNGVTAIATTVTTALGAAIAFLTSPITLTIAAITVLVAAGVLLYKNWDVVNEKCAQLRDWVVKKTTELKDGAVKAFTTLSTNVKNAMGVLVTSVQNKWDEAKKLFQKFRDFLTGVFEKDWTKSFGALGTVLNTFFRTLSNIFKDIKKIFNGIVEFVSGVFAGDWRKAWEGIKDIFAGVFEGLTDLARAPINAIISAFNGVLGIMNGLVGKLNNIRFRITVPDWIPGIGGSWWGFDGFNIPSIGTIPPLAQGGFVEKNTPQLAMIGDNRHQGEVVAPEDKLREMALEAVKAAGTSGITRDELERIINSAVMRIVAALSEMGFYLDSTQVARATRNAQQAIDLRYNTVEVG